MKVRFECYRCISRMMFDLAQAATQDDAGRCRLITQLLKHLGECSPTATAPEIIGGLNELTQKFCANYPDPWREVKQKSTILGLQLLEPLRRLVQKSPDYFASVVKLAIGGNIIDFGANPNFDLATAQNQILAVLDYPLELSAVRDLQQRMTQAKKIIYLMDNCGEAVLDRLLLELFPDKIIVGVRGCPILNDVTRDDAVASGIDFCPIIDSGDGAPGICPHRCSPQFRQTLQNCDLVIAKGQGNFEALEAVIERPAYFLFRAKCSPIAEFVGVPRSSLQLVGRHLTP